MNLSLTVGVFCQPLLERQGKLTRSKQTQITHLFFTGVFLLSPLSYNCHKYSYILLAKHIGSPSTPNRLGSVKLFIMACSLKGRMLWQGNVVERRSWKKEKGCDWEISLVAKTVYRRCMSLSSETADSDVDGEV